MNLINKKTEEILKWRQQQDIMNYNHRENSPIFLSRHQQQQGETPLFISGTQISSITTNSTDTNLLNSPLKYNNDEMKNNSAKFYITLAKESPIHSDENDDTTATYDSYHDRTTDGCMDSCDTESNSSAYSIQGIATVEFVEYEVASASSSEDLYSNDSSSGTDEDLIAMAKEFLESELVSVDKRSGCGFWSSDFADTEESDNSDNCIDSELSPADYWLCVKCKNRQNNPMFRYCEKCYQIRKTHFPPRPNLRKIRKNRTRKSPIFSHNSIESRRRKLNSSPNSNDENELTEAGRKSSNILNQVITSYNPDASTSTNKIGNNDMNLTNSNIIKYNKISEENSKLNGNKIKTNNSKPYKKRKLNFTNSSNQLNSAAETSSSDDDDSYSSFLLRSNSNSSFENSSKLGKKFFSPTKNENINNLTLKHKSQIFDTSKSANISYNNSSFSNRKRKASIVTAGDDIDSGICSQPKMKYINKEKIDINLNSDDSETDLVNNHDIINNHILFDKDSGVSSAPSTQDYGELLIPELLKPHCSTSINEPSSKLQKMSESNEILKHFSLGNTIIELKADGNESSDTVCNELNEKEVVELEKNFVLTQDIHESTCLTNNISKSINNNITNNEVKQKFSNNLDRHMSEFSPIINKTNSLMPRSMSVTDIIDCKSNLRIIESPQSPSTIALKNNTNNNCTTNFDDKFSSLLKDNQTDSSYGLCIICVTEPKNGAFVHSRFVHLSCCYKCAVKIWNKNKKCPICNCAVKNVMKLFVH